ncbi:MAG: ribosome-associated translation inhibitor RaiA [Candidatus Paceibacterota bacterium]
MNINIKATNTILTDEIRAYVEKRVGGLEKFIKNYGKEIFIQVEVGKTTNRHISGDIFRTEINIDVSGRNFRAVSEKDSLFASIDDAEVELKRELVSYKDKRQTTFRKGALKVKEFLKSLGGK